MKMRRIWVVEINLEGYTGWENTPSKTHKDKIQEKGGDGR